MSDAPKPVQQQLSRLRQWQKSMQSKGITPLSEGQLQQAIASQDQQRFTELQQQRQQQQQKNIEVTLTSSDINPKWTMDTVQSLLHQRNPAEDFTSAFCTLDLLCEHMAHHKETGGVCWMLLGAYGRGKSTLAGAMYHEYIKRQHSAIMIQWQKLVRHVWAGGDSAKALLAQIYQVDLLVLDEVGYDRRNLRDGEQALLSTIIRNRKSNCRSLVLCSNHYPSTFEEAIGMPSAQGLRDYKTYTSVFEGKSHRETLFTDLNGRSVADIDGDPAEAILQLP
jgi:DNA replication protein DnaC